MTAEKEQPNNDKNQAMENGTEEDNEQATVNRQLEDSRASIQKLEQELAARDSEISALRHSLNELKTESGVLNEDLVCAVAAYREMIQKANPGVMAEFITGDTLDEINESLKNARLLVDKVRQGIESEAAQTRIPAGAPSRSEQDISALSPREKIQLALGDTSSRT
jgi:chromosome segregation ATPase